MGANYPEIALKVKISQIAVSKVIKLWPFNDFLGNSNTKEEM